MQDRRKENAAGFESYVRRMMSEKQVPGIAVAVVSGEGNTLYENFFGVRDIQTAAPIDGDTIFGLASVTKSFTCAAVMQLQERGLLDIDDLVSKYIPELTGDRPVRIWHLMCHSGGYFPLPRILADDVAREMGIFEDKDGDLAHSERLAQKGVELVASRLAAQTNLTGRPGEHLSYCNDGFGILAEVVHRASGERSFAAYVEKNILQPLGMDRSTCEFMKPAADKNCATLYEGDKADRNFYDNAFVLMGGGVLKSTLNNMKNYIRMHLSEGLAPSGQRVLSEYSIREMHKPHQVYSLQEYYGYGLSIHHMGDVVCIGHGGSLHGVSSNLQFSPQLGLGVMVLCNQTGVPVAGIAEAAMRWFAGLPLEKPDIFVDTPWTGRQLKDAVGVYRSGEGTVCEIFDKDGVPGVRVDGREVTARPVEPNVLEVGDSPDSRGLMITLRSEERGIYAVRYGARLIPKEQ